MTKPAKRDCLRTGTYTGTEKGKCELCLGQSIVLVSYVAVRYSRTSPNLILIKFSAIALLISRPKMKIYSKLLGYQFNVNRFSSPLFCSNFSQTPTDQISITFSSIVR